MGHLSTTYNGYTIAITGQDPEKLLEKIKSLGVKKEIEYTPGTWFEADTPDDLEAFFLSRLPAIREAAKELGYAIGLHGSCRRDFDLIAMPWTENPSDIDILARAIGQAACGITRDGPYQWEKKPGERVATSLPVCWYSAYVLSGGHIDLSVPMSNWDDYEDKDGRGYWVRKTPR